MNETKECEYEQELERYELLRLMQEEYIQTDMDCGLQGLRTIVTIQER